MTARIQRSVFMSSELPRPQDVETRRSSEWERAPAGCGGGVAALWSVPADEHPGVRGAAVGEQVVDVVRLLDHRMRHVADPHPARGTRSEERRVGKEWRCRW